MESDKQNRVPVISDVAAPKEAPSPRPAKVPKAEKNSKPANVKVVDVVLKQSPDKGPQQNTRPNASTKKDSQSVGPPSGPVNQQPVSCQRVTEQPSCNIQPTINPTPANHPAGIQQPAPSEPIVIQQPVDSGPAKNERSVNNDPAVHQSLPNSQPNNTSTAVNLNQQPENSIVANQQTSIVNRQPETQQPVTSQPLPLKTQPLSCSQPPVSISNPSTICSMNQQPVINQVHSQGPALPQAPLISNHVPVVPVQSVAPLPPTATAPIKVHKHKDEKHKKEDKSVTHVLKALNSLNTTEEKLAALCKKYADMFDENRKLQLLVKQSEKKVQQINREKEQLQSEHSKVILTRSALESLCRELQKQNKAIKEESIAKMREEEEKRTEISTKFQNTLGEITALMQQNNDKNNKLRDDNIDMTSRLKSVCEQYQLREQQVEKLGKQMELEVQLCDAKLAKAKMEMTAEKEILLREKQQLLMELTTYQNRCQELQSIEVDLRKQIALYNNKYDEFQQALTKSSTVFSGFKVEMDKMSKKITKLEKETSTWKKRWEQSHQAVLEMAVDKQVSDQELKKTSRQLTALQSLCRTLQTERTQLLGTVKKLTGGGELSDGEKMVNTENGPQAIETLMTKIEIESCDADVKQESTPVSGNQHTIAPVPISDTSADGLSPQTPLDTSQLTCANPLPAVAADNKKTSETQSNIESKNDAQCDSSIKASTKKVKKEEEAPTNISESLASIEECCKSVGSLVSVISSLSLDKPPSQPDIDNSPLPEKNDNKCAEITSASSVLPEQTKQAENQSKPASLEPGLPKSDVTPPPVNLTEQNSGGRPKSPAAQVNAVNSNVNKTVPPTSNSKPEIVGSVPKVGPKIEKIAPINGNSKEPVPCPNGSAAKTCDKKEPKLVAEQKKKESSKKRKK